MEQLKKIVNYCDTFLNKKKFKDGCWNGLQFEGSSTVKKIVFAVDTGVETFEKAAEEKADLVIVHHGMFWTYNSPCIIGLNKRRLDILYKNNISLYASHIPLDAHKTVGNNIQLLKMAGAKVSGEFGIYRGKPISFMGKYKTPVSLKSIESKLNKALPTQCMSLPFGPGKIKSIGVITGSAGHTGVDEAIEAGLDCYITGEQVDAYQKVKDAKINIIFAGHNATETLGVKALMKTLSKEFKVKTSFISIPTGL